MSKQETFQVRIVGSDKTTNLVVRTSQYAVAAAAVPAMLGMDLPVDLEIWCDRLLPDYGPYFYRVEFDECVRVVVNTLVAAPRE